MDLGPMVSAATADAMTSAGAWLGQLGPMVGILFAVTVLGAVVGVLMAFMPR